MQAVRRASPFLLTQIHSKNPVSLSEIEIGLVDMTDSGPSGVTYEALPSGANLASCRLAQSEIQIGPQENAGPDNYNAAVRVYRSRSLFEYCVSKSTFKKFNRIFRLCNLRLPCSWGSQIRLSLDQTLLACQSSYHLSS
jgi:hypothetical protein